MPAQPRTSALLKDKKVVVIGGTSGIGFAVASALIEEGSHVVVSSSNPTRVEDAVKRLSDPETQYNGEASRVSGLPLKLGGGPEVEARLEAFFAEIGEFDHLVFTAGDNLAIKTFAETSYDDIIAAGQIRFIGAILAVKVATSKYLKKGGSIVLTNGSISRTATLNWAIVNGYSTGMLGVVRNLALDLSPKDIRINTVSPGAVETELWDNFSPEQRESVFHELSKTSLTQPGKIASPYELAQSYLYLLKDTNITGEVINSDSGFLYGPRPSN